jgi:hypothetical protein
LMAARATRNLKSALRRWRFFVIIPSTCFVVIVADLYFTCGLVSGTNYNCYLGTREHFVIARKVANFAPSEWAKQVFIVCWFCFVSRECRFLIETEPMHPYGDIRRLFCHKMTL